MNIDDLIQNWEAEYNKGKGEHSSIFDPLGVHTESVSPWELSPCRLFDYIMTLSKYKFSTYIQFNPPIRFQTILENWINNFTLEERDKLIAFKLASRILFITERELEYLQNYVYKLFTSQYKILIDKSLGEFLFISLEEDVKVADFFRINKVPGRKDIVNGSRSFLNSIDELLKEIKKIEKIDRLISKMLALKDYKVDKTSNKTIVIEEVISIMQDYKTQIAADLGKRKEALKGKKYLVLLTNFSGSGATVENDIKRILTNYSFEAVFLFSYVISHKSLLKLSELSEIHSNKLKIIPGLILPAEVQCFGNNSILFSEDDKQEVKKLCDNYFDKLKGHADVEKWGKKIKYGYNKTRLTLVLPHNCPNSTIPVVWAENKDWKALFPRIPSYIKHSTAGRGQQ